MPLRSKTGTLADERGVSMVEYVVILALVALVAMGTWAALGQSIDEQVTCTANSIAANGGGCRDPRGADGRPTGSSGRARTGLATGGSSDSAAVGGATGALDYAPPSALGPRSALLPPSAVAHLGTTVSTSPHAIPYAHVIGLGSTAGGGSSLGGGGGGGGSGSGPSGATSEPVSSTEQALTSAESGTGGSGGGGSGGSGGGHDGARSRSDRRHDRHAGSGGGSSGGGGGGSSGGGDGGGGSNLPSHFSGSRGPGSAPGSSGGGGGGGGGSHGASSGGGAIRGGPYGAGARPGIGSGSGDGSRGGDAHAHGDRRHGHDGDSSLADVWNQVAKGFNALIPLLPSFLRAPLAFIRTLARALAELEQGRQHRKEHHRKPQHEHHQQDGQTETGYRDGEPFPIRVVPVDGELVEVSTATVYKRMRKAAARDGITLRVVSGFRSNEEQGTLYQCYLDYQSSGTCSCSSCNLAAPPGTSNHQSGHALDLNTSDPGVYDWLSSHGGEFGFERTVPSEDWHWEYWGPA